MHDHVITAVPVPFETDGSLDLPAYRALLESIADHVDAVLVAGTTGEFPALEDDERIALVEETVGVVGGERTIAHVGAAGLGGSIALGHRAVDAGAGRLALLSPYYLPAEHAMVHDWFASFVAAVGDGADGVPTFAYFFPERTGVQLGPRMTAEVLAMDGIAGIKLSGAANERFTDAVAAARAGQQVYTGDDSVLPQTLARGGTGVISGVSSVFASRYAALSAALGAGPRGAEQLSAEAAERQEAVLRAVAAVGPSIARLKVALAERTGRPWASRMPMPELPGEVRELIREELSAG